MKPDPHQDPRDAIDFGEEPEDPHDLEPAWDADDERRQKDQFAPPMEPCECYCLHCQRVFMSDQMWFQKVINSRDGFEGFWMCPTPNCGGAGFTFDIFPTDPDHPANEGWYSDDGEWEDDDEAEAEYDPDETKFKPVAEEFGGDEAAAEDLEGEEWKYGLSPGERPPPPEWVEKARREWEEEQKKYDEPDERPRVLDWSDRDHDRPPPGSAEITEDDIPF